MTLCALAFAGRLLYVAIIGSSPLAETPVQHSNYGGTNIVDHGVTSSTSLATVYSATTAFRGQEKILTMLFFITSYAHNRDDRIIDQCLSCYYSQRWWANSVSRSKKAARKRQNMQWGERNARQSNSLIGYTHRESGKYLIHRAVNIAY